MSYLFDPQQLHEISIEATKQGTTLEEKFSYVIDTLSQQYPGRINMETKWILNSANGALGTMTILYASLSEYILLFGSPIGTEGHSGRYFADVYDFMLEGEMWTYYEGETERRVYLPGDAAHLGRRRAKGYCLREQGWMLEYARGCIPAMLPMGLADNFFSNLDFRSVWYTLLIYGKLTIRELLRGKI